METPRWCPSKGHQYGGRKVTETALLSFGIKSIRYHSRYRIHSRWHFFKCKNRSKARGGTPYNGLYGEAPPERGTFFRLQVYKRVGISQV